MSRFEEFKQHSMSKFEEFKQFIDLKIKEYRYLWKQAEALEQMAVGTKGGARRRLGKYGPRANIHLNLWTEWENSFNDICELPPRDRDPDDPYDAEILEIMEYQGAKVDTLIQDFAQGVWQSSASLNATGLKTVGETLQNIKNPDMGPTKNIPQPTHMDSKNE